MASSIGAGISNGDTLALSIILFVDLIFLCSCDQALVYEHFQLCFSNFSTFDSTEWGVPGTLDH